MDEKTIDGDDFYQVAGGMVSTANETCEQKGALRVWIAQIA